MANRSYIYTIDFDKSKRKQKDTDKILGLSEYKYSIPLSFKLLISQDTRICDSMIWDYEKPLAIIGDYKKGRERLLAFLEELKTKELFDETELEDRIKMTKQSLFDSKRDMDFVLLECGELYEMTDIDLGLQNQELFDEIKNINSAIEDFYADIERLNQKEKELADSMKIFTKPIGFFTKLFRGKKREQEQSKAKRNMSNIEREKWNTLGIDFWVETLYFHFPDNTGNE